MAQQAPDLKARIEETLKKVKMNEVSFIGVLAEDANACYAGQLQKLQTETGTEKTQIVLIAVAVVKNKNIFVYRMTVYKGPERHQSAGDVQGYDRRALRGEQIVRAVRSLIGRANTA